MVTLFNRQAISEDALTRLKEQHEEEMKVLVDTAEEEANSLKEQIKQLELSTQHSLPAVSTVSVQPIIYTI